MKKLTFAYDVELNEQEDWIAAGTTVEASPHDFFIKRYKGFTPVVITEAMSYDGKPVKVEPYVEWFSNKSFKGGN